MRFRVSHVESYRYWRQVEDATIQELIAQIEDNQPTEAMRRGTAFHSAIEKASDGIVDEITVGGFTFCFDGDFQLPLRQVREVRAFKDYGGIEVTGQVDHIYGNLIDDYKTTTNFNPERYMEGYPWRFYLDIFNADRFRWSIFEMFETEDRVYSIRNLHVLEQCRYPDLEQDCRNLALEMKQFAEQHLLKGLAA